MQTRLPEADRTWPGRWLAAGAVAAYGLATAATLWLSQGLASDQIVWLPFGLYFAALLRLPVRVWPLLVAGAFGIDLSSGFVGPGVGLATTMGHALANATQAVCGAALTLRLTESQRREAGALRLEHLTTLVLVVTAGGAAVIAVGAPIRAAVTMLTTGGSFLATWLTWWVSELAAIMLLAPALLLSDDQWQQAVRTWRGRPAETLAAGATFALVSAVVLWSGYAPALLLPALIWVALRFEMVGVAIALPGLTVLGQLAVSNGYSVFAAPGSGSIVHFLIGVGTSLLLLAAARAEGRRSERQVDDLNQALARRVDEQTASLRETVARLSLALGVAELGTWQWRVGTSDFSADDRLRAIFGFDEPTLTREAFWARCHPDDVEPLTAELEAWLQRRGNWEFEHRAVDAQRATRWLRGRASMVTQDDGAVLAVGVVSDVTEERDAEERKRQAERAQRESNRLFRQLADHLEAGLWVFDVEAGRLRFLSEGFTRLWGFSTAGSVEHWKALVHPDDLDRFETEYGKIQSGESRENDFDYRLCLPDGRQRWVNTTAFAVSPDGEGLPSLVVGLNLDTTTRREAEHALREMNRRRAEFLTMLAHELRNPLAAIRSAAQVLRARPDQDGVVADASAVVERQVAYVARIVDDLLDESRLTHGRLVLQPLRVDLAEIVRQTVDDHRMLFERKGVVLMSEVPDEPLWVDGDATRLAQVVGNLLHNASKFTDAAGQVGVLLRRDAGGGEIVLSVRDSGRGIEPALLPRVFEPFTQAQADQALGRSPAGGIGLGLSLVKGIVRLHGGRVTAKSDGVGRGAAFEVRLPRATRPATRARPEVPRAARPLRIVVVEDSVDVATMLRTQLAFEGHDVSVAHSGRAGVELVEARRPDLVLCDLGLPGELDGFDVARTLRARGCASHLVALTGYAGEEHREAAADAGFDRHLTKPLRHDDLIRLCVSLAGGAASAADAAGGPTGEWA